MIEGIHLFPERKGQGVNLPGTSSHAVVSPILRRSQVSCRSQISWMGYWYAFSGSVSRNKTGLDCVMRADTYETEWSIRKPRAGNGVSRNCAAAMFTSSSPDTTTPRFQSLFGLGIIEIPRPLSPSTEFPVAIFFSQQTLIPFADPDEVSGDRTPRKELANNVKNPSTYPPDSCEFPGGIGSSSIKLGQPQL